MNNPEVAKSSVENVERDILDAVQASADFPWWLGQHKNAARCALVDPILWALGWNTALPSQCRPDFPLIGGRKADHARLDSDARLAAGLLIGRSPSRRSSDRARLRDTVRGQRMESRCRPADCNGNSTT